MPGRPYQGAFSIWEKVCFAGDESIVATVTAYMFRGSRDPVVEISYFHNGDWKVVWVDEALLRSAPVRHPT